MEDRKRELQAPLTISAILVLVELRLHQVERVLLGGGRPAALVGAAQRRVSHPIQAEDEEHDLALSSWGESVEDEESLTWKRASPSPAQGTLRKTGPSPVTLPIHPGEGSDQLPTTEPKS
jgi:hypothetical protein